MYWSSLIKELFRSREARKLFNSSPSTKLSILTDEQNKNITRSKSLFVEISGLLSFNAKDNAVDFERWPGGRVKDAKELFQRISENVALSKALTWN